MLEQPWPLPTLQHLLRLTDDCGIIQHAKFWLPNYATGYCVDDNSRALLVAHTYYRLYRDETAHDLMVRYLAFIHYVQRTDGRIINFVDYNRSYLEEEGSADSVGRTIWALGDMCRAQEEYLAIPAREMLLSTVPLVNEHSYPHAQAYAILGLTAYGEHAEHVEEARRYARPLAVSLTERYVNSRTEGWDWLQPIMTYANARFPESLLRAGVLLDNVDMIDAGLRMLNFLNMVCYRFGHLSVVGCHGWYPRNGRCAQFHQQPIDAGGMVEVNLLAHRISGNDQYFDLAVRAMEWFYGRNDLGIPLYNPQSGGCYDGLHSQGVNTNQGAESTIALLLAQLAMYQYAPHLYASSLMDMPVDNDRIA